ncbi:XRE family transcriptional regulator [Dyadobacter frigoris]|uniref:LexA family transcriptional regulator n=1 Tax=Dyadobacter frigoris TaxID=2576211 RepID=A0A4U6CKJ0_9BACT|nr:LexA family transcriptional regulator [Dyadobacter frigoris]TKT84722.1 LexA family transcriptional regulator [Dyadobacter frigoris]
MEAQEIFLKENLKFLRQRKKLTQESLAEALDMSRVKLKAIETGTTANPAVQDIVLISRYFKIATDTFLLVNLAKLGELKLRELEAGSDVYLTGKNIRVVAITINPDSKENVEYVPIKAKAGYRAGHTDPEYLAALPKFNIPNLPSGYTYRMFPTSGDSMLPIPEGSDILARYVQNWKDLKAATLCIVILVGDQEFVFKQVTITPDGLLLHSMNKLYEDYTVDFSDVLEIWEYYSFHSKQLPEAMTDLTTVIREIRKLEVKITSKPGQ